MVRPCAVLLFAVAVASSLQAQSASEYRYIIPVTGNIESTGGIFYSYTRIINLSTSKATVAFDLYPADPAARCIDTPATLGGGDFATLGGRCEGIYAAVLRSDQPLYVRSEVLSYGRETFLDGPDEEPVPVATAFIPADQRALVPDVQAGPGWRANLVVVNPNDRPINVRVTGVATVVGQGMAFRVRAKSLLLVPVTDLAVAGDPVTGARHFIVTSDGPFQVGASSVRGDGRAQYRAGVAIGAAPPPQ